MKASACQADGAPPRGLEPHRFRFARMSKWSAQRRRPARRFLLQGQGRACFGRCAMEDFFLRSSEGVHWGDFVFASTAPPLAATACALRQRFLLPPIVATAKGARACGPRRAMARGRRTSYKRTNQTRYASATVAILAQGTSWAVAVTQAYLHCPKIGPPWPRNALSSLLAASSLACSVASLSAFREDHLRDHYCLRSICLAEC